MKTIVPILLVSCLSNIFCTLKAQQPPVNPIFKPLDNGYQLLYKEAFDKGDKPNEQDWMFRKNKKMGGASIPDNVTVGKATDGSDIGCLSIHFTYDSTLPKDEQYRGGGIVSTHNFGYGYYETKVKLYGGKPEWSGLHQSFWSMGLTGTNEGEGKGVRDIWVNKDLMPKENRVLEIDGFEHNSKDNALAQNYHIYTPTHLSEAPKNHQVKKDLTRWIKMGYEWLPDKINFYCDDTLISTKKLEGKWAVYAPQNFWLTALPVSTKWWGGLSVPPPSAAMQVDYFTFYAKKIPTINLIGNAGFEYGNTENNYPIAWVVPQTNNNPDAVKVVTDSLEAKQGKRFLELGCPNNSPTIAKQIIEYIPNGKYDFSVWVKGSKSKTQSVITIYVGTKAIEIPIKVSDTWQKVERKNINVSGNRATIEIKYIGKEGEVLKLDEAVFSAID